MLRAVLLLLCIKLITSNYLRIEKDYSSRLSLTKCLTEAGKLYFDQNDVVTISLSTTEFPTGRNKSAIALDELLLKDMYTINNWTVLVKKPTVPSIVYKRGSLKPIDFRKSDAYILQIRSYEEVEFSLNIIKSHPSWYPHAKFIVISSYYFENQNQVIAKIIKQLWTLDVLNGVILFPTLNNATTYTVFSWFPYANGRCGNYFNKIMNVTTCSYGEMSHQTNWFEKKIPKNLNGCTVKARTLVYPPFVMNPKKGKYNSNNNLIFEQGLDIKLFNLVAEVANFTINYSMSGLSDDWGNVNRRDGTRTGIIGLLYEGAVDIGFGSMSASTERHSILDSTTAYFLDSLGFCVPHAEQKPQWKKLSQIMTLQVWIFIIIAIITLIILTKWISLYSDEFIAYKCYKSIGQKIIAITLASAINLQPKSSRVRIVLMLWIIFALHLDTAYQTYLMSVLTEPDYEPQIRNIEDILSSDLDMLFLPSSKRYFSHHNNAVNNAVIKRWHNCSDLDLCLERTAYYADSALAASRLYTTYSQNIYKTKTGEPLIYCFRHSIVTFPIVMYMRMGFPLKDRIDELINRINAAGYMERWESNIFAKKISNYTEHDDARRLLRLQHLRPIFLVAFVAYGLGLTVFGLEIAMFRFKSNK